MRARKMTRSFSDEPLPEQLILSLLDTACRAPSAGSSQGTEFLVLAGTEETSRYWDITLPEPQRGSFRWQGLLRAPLIVVVYADSERYLERYGEPDKAGTGLGVGRERWSTPYWLVDASFAAMALQLAALDEGLGVLVFGLFGHAEAVAEAFCVPKGPGGHGGLLRSYSAGPEHTDLVPRYLHYGLTVEWMLDIDTDKSRIADMQRCPVGIDITRRQLGGNDRLPVTHYPHDHYQRSEEHTSELQSH